MRVFVAFLRLEMESMVPSAGYDRIADCDVVRALCGCDSSKSKWLYDWIFIHDWYSVYLRYHMMDPGAIYGHR